MVVFPNCKINLGLSVLRKRPDNFHDLKTIFYPLPFYDVLEIIQAPVFSMNQTGIGLDVDAAQNICVRAWQLLQRDHPQLPQVLIHLHKNIPAGAGLGGGSADAAFLLSTVNKKFRLGISHDRLAAYALELGSDCAFFLVNKPAVATGRGEILEPVSLDLSAYRLMVINPSIHVNTGEAFAMITPRDDGPDPEEIISLPIDQWKGRLVNDFEAPVFARHPEVQAVRDKLYDAGALFAAMSGSGSTVFGIFSKEVPVPVFPAGYLVKVF
ncbi:MAG: 4-(cytidine 5'-diphospho)-2-C-methyl-D-erythritol kinase [Chitinophagaceae bacterium]|nr:MAG: 4-(cytidine 5'-diphospho)-2-C-methyl-D-erythritol kinase [Chitinophagaceae bacterium]